MPVTLTTESEGLTPVGGHPVAVELRCDHCGEAVGPGSGGLAAWEPDRGARYLDVALLHGDCVEGYRGVLVPDRHRESRDLETAALGPFLAALVHNLEVAG